MIGRVLLVAAGAAEAAVAAFVLTNLRWIRGDETPADWVAPVQVAVGLLAATLYALAAASALATARGAAHGRRAGLAALAATHAVVVWGVLVMFAGEI